MLAIANKNKKNNKFLPMISLIKNEEELRKSAKIQLMEEIINNPESLKAYKELEIYKIAEINEELEITNTKKEILFSYEQILEEIVKTITKEQKKNEFKKI